MKTLWQFMLAWMALALCSIAVVFVAMYWFIRAIVPVLKPLFH